MVSANAAGRAESEAAMRDLEAAGLISDLEVGSAGVRYRLCDPASVDVGRAARALGISRSEARDWLREAAAELGRS